MGGCTHSRRQRRDVGSMKPHVPAVPVCDASVIVPIAHRDATNTLAAFLSDVLRGQRLTRIFRATTDGMSAVRLHEVVDGVPGTVVLFKTTEGLIGGGYASKEWGTGPCYVADPEAFLFFLSDATSPRFVPFKSLPSGRDSKHLYLHGDRGLRWGDEHALFLDMPTEAHPAAYLNLGGTFTTGPAGRGLPRWVGGGQFNFTVAELEVFALPGALLRAAVHGHAALPRQVRPRFPAMRDSSRMLTPREARLIEDTWVPEWLRAKAGQRYKCVLLYSLTQHEATLQAFYGRVDGVPCTVTVAQSVRGAKFGGFNPAAWTRGDTTLADPVGLYEHVPGARVFRLRGIPDADDGLGAFYCLPQDQRTVHSFHRTGPCFGSGVDLLLAWGPGAYYHACSTSLGNSYAMPEGVDGDRGRLALTGGDEQFVLQDLEVYAVLPVAEPAGIATGAGHGAGAGVPPVAVVTKHVQGDM